MAFDIGDNWEKPRFSTLDLIVKHFNSIPNNMLYRYRSCNENEFRVLERNSIYLSKASHFKDKLDSAIFYDFDNLSSKQKHHLVKAYTIANYCNAYVEFKDSFNKREMPHPTVVKNFVEKCYDKNFNLIQSKFDKFVIKNHGGNEDEFRKKLLELDGIFAKEGRGEQLEKWLIEKEKRAAISATKENQDETFACSFTELPDNLSMWENYANNYSGFCVGYKFEGVYMHHMANSMLRACMMQLLPMIYTDNNNVHSGYAFAMEQNEMMYNRAIGKKERFDSFWYYYMMLSMLNKNKSYDWEKEWRIVLFNLKSNIIYFPFATRIYLGKDINKENKEKLIKIARKKNLAVYQQRLDEAKGKYSYDFIIPRIDYQKGESQHVIITGNPYL